MTNKFAVNIVCACGCGQLIKSIDNWGRIRKYVRNHDKRGKPRPYSVRKIIGEKNSGSNSGAWKGGRRKNPRGYILVWNPNHPDCDGQGYILEHRLVLEKKLGRRLKRKEVGHHINGIRHDNRPENLSLFKNREEHSRYERNLKLMGVRKH